MFIFNAKLEDASRLEQTLIGRKHIADWLEKQVLNFVETGQPLRELLIGPRGSGKTHLLGVLYNRIASRPEVQQKLAIAYMSEDEYGIDTYLDLLVRIFKALSRLTAAQEEKNRALQYIEQLKLIAPEQRIAYAERYLLEYLNGRYLLVLIENLNDIFAGINEGGQSQWRDFIQTHDNTGIVATSQAIFKDVNNRNKPFFGFFHITYLPKLSFDDALELMRTLAGYDQRDDLLQHLNTDEGRGNIRAIYELTEGNHRLLVTFYNFLKTDFKCELSRAFLQTLDKLKPYYESFLKLLSHQQQKIVQYLALQRVPQTGTQIAQNCFLQPTTVSKQMSELQRLAYVDAHKEGREAYYEITEPLLRICIEVNEDREGIIKLFVDFLGRLYTAPDLKKGFLRFSLLQDLVTPDLLNNYRDEARYYSRAIEAYVDGWQPSLEEQEKVLSLKTIEERERMIEEVVQVSEGVDLEKKSGHLIDILANSKDDFTIKSDRKRTLVDATITGNSDERSYVVVDKKGNEHHITANDREQLCAVWLITGFFCFEQKQFEKAENAFRNALEIKPDLEVGWQALGILYQEQNLLEKAETAYQESLKIEPTSFVTWVQLGKLYFKQGWYKKTELACTKAIEIEPKNIDAWKILGFIYKMQSQFKKAQDAYKKALKLSPDESGIWSDLGDLYKEQKNFELAEGAYKKALEINSDEHKAWYGLGYLFEAQEAFEKAGKAFQKAVEIKPDEYFYWFNLGYSCKIQGQFEKAEIAYQKALEIKPDFYLAWNFLASLYIETAEWSKAKEAVSQFEKYCSDDDAGKLMYLSARLGDLQQYLRAATRNAAQSEDGGLQERLIMPLLHSKPDMIKAVFSAAISGKQADMPIRGILRQILPVYIKGDSPDLEQLKSIRNALTDLYGQDEYLNYPLKYFALAIRYFREGEKKAIYELTKEERKAFFEWAGEGENDEVKD
jgi:tetratricopeptide (TPR) repeat protein